MRSTLRLAAGALACAAACPRQAAAQLYPAQPARYLLTTDAADVRALWVNPAGLARRPEASIGGDATLDRTSGTLRLSQVGLSLQSRNLAFGWSRNRYRDRSTASTYALGLGLGDEALSAGVTRRWYRGGRSARAWDVAVRARATPVVDVSLVWRLIGSPVVRDTGATPLHTWPASFVPAASVRLFDGRLRVAAEAEVETRLSGVRGLRTGAAFALGGGFELTLRGDFSPSFDRRGFAFALSWDRTRGRTALTTILPADAGSLDAVGATGFLVSALPTRRLH